MRPITNDFILGNGNSFAGNSYHAPEPPDFDL